MTINNLRDNDTNKTVELDSLSFFNSDPYFNFVYKKSERLCMAIYLITDFFPKEDSIKDKMRISGTELIKTSLSLITSSSSFRKDILNDISRLCLEIVSLSKISANLGMTSVPNHNVLESEIKTFIGVIEERERPSTTGQGFVLNEEVLGGVSDISVFIPVNVPVSVPVATPITSAVSAIVPKDVAPQNPAVLANASKSYFHVEKKTIQPHSHSTSHSTRNENHMDSMAPAKSDAKPEVAVKSVMQKNDRQQFIIEIIKEIGESSIKDISDNIKDCSEKTIQRELNTLIYDGVLKKIGERRWSKYILA